MKLLTQKTCTTCGGKIVRKGLNCGYSSAKELGRPAGAKGRDEFAIIDECQDCGGGRYEILPIPCHICNGQSTQYIDLASRCEEVTGIFDFVPGLPSSINLCASAKCETALNNTINRLVSEATQENGYE